MQQGTSQNILMRPFNNFSARFVEMVKYCRVILVVPILSALAETVGSLFPDLAGDAALEEESLVLRDKGAGCRAVTLRGAMAVMTGQCRTECWTRMEQANLSSYAP